MRITQAVGVSTIVAAGLAGYRLYEPRLYRFTSKDVDVGEGAPPLDVLHISDTHMRARDERLVRWLRALPGELGTVPDVVVATGDLIEEDASIDPLVRSLDAVDARLGRFYVFGSHDY